MMNSIMIEVLSEKDGVVSFAPTGPGISARGATPGHAFTDVQRSEGPPYFRSPRWYAKPMKLCGGPSDRSTVFAQNPGRCPGLICGAPLGRVPGAMLRDDVRCPVGVGPGSHLRCPLDRGNGLNPRRIVRRIRSRIFAKRRGIHPETSGCGDVLPVGQCNGEGCLSGSCPVKKPRILFARRNRAVRPLGF